MTIPGRRAWMLAVLLSAVLVVSAGCLSARSQSLLVRQPRQRVFRPEDAPRLPEGEPVSLHEFDSGGGQSVCLLRMAPDAKLDKRYHAKHDSTLMLVSGNAIVQVEETRYFVGPGSAVLLPRYTAYAVIPHETKEDVLALIVCSPPYDEDDVKLTR